LSEIKKIYAWRGFNPLRSASVSFDTDGDSMGTTFETRCRRAGNTIPLLRMRPRAAFG
jgi:hypothetical protein